jgi:hypothetical protein
MPLKIKHAQGMHVPNFASSSETTDSAKLMWARSWQVENEKLMKDRRKISKLSCATIFKNHHLRGFTSLLLKLRSRRRPDTFL